jgi:hypothetical protein
MAGEEPVDIRALSDEVTAAARQASGRFVVQFLLSALSFRG